MATTTDDKSQTHAVGLQRHVAPFALKWVMEKPDLLWQQVDCTLCFADISGFTALAERLAQLGRVGGEELVETLGRVFTQMIGIARGYGGSLLKFGGDALLFIFEGENHAVNGASAAIEMRRALKQAANEPTTVGPLKLSMSVGVHSGETLFFLVGHPHRELVLLGPGVNKVIDAEGTAEAGEIVITQETAAKLPKSAYKQRGDGRLLLRWRKGVVTGQQPTNVPLADAAIVAKLLPESLATFLQDDAPDPEHRVACISFVRFSGTDQLIQKLGAEKFAPLLHNTLAQIMNALDSEGVTLLAVDIDQDGGKLFLAAGIPYAHVDDEGVMLRALRSICDTTLPLPLQMGVSRGHVFAAEIGDAQRAAFSAMGDTTNTAARIMSKTPIGKIFAHPSTLDECQTRYQVTPAEPLLLKGKRNPLVVYEVGDELGLRKREGLSTQQIVGRESELILLRAAIAQLKQGKGSVVSIKAESGLGKSRLINETIADVEHHISLRGEPYGANSAYRMMRDPIRKMLNVERASPEVMQRQLANAVNRLAPELSSMLALIGDIVDVKIEPSAEVQALEPRFRPERAAEALVTLLISKYHHLIVVVDDAHWADDATSLILARLEKACSEYPWLMMVAYRDGSSGYRPNSGEILELSPLPAAEMRHFIEQITEAAPLREHDITSIIRRAEGFPLFAEEIVRALRDLGSLDAVPESLEAAMSNQVAALDRNARRTLQYASVLGRSFSKSLLSALLQSEEQTIDPNLLDRLADFLVQEDGERLRFRNSMLRDTVYEGIAFRTRRRLHQSAGLASEAQTEQPEQIADMLALHFAQAGDHQRVWKYARIAGDAAAEDYANAAAAQFYELALSVSRSANALDNERLDLSQQLGTVRLLSGQFESALEAYRDTLKFARSNAYQRAKAYLELAKVKEQIGRFSQALGDLTRAERLLSDQQDKQSKRLIADIASFRTLVLYSLERIEQAHEQATQAAHISKQVGARYPLARALTILEMTRVMMHGPGEAPDLTKALSIYEALGDTRSQAGAQTNLGVIAAMSGQWDEAGIRFAGAADLYDRCGDNVQSALAAKNLGELRLSQGRNDEAHEVLYRAQRVMRASGWTEGLAMVHTQVGMLLIEEDKLDEADALLARTIEDFNQLGQPHAALEAAALRACGLIRAGLARDALKLLQEVTIGLEDEMGMLTPKIELAKALAYLQLHRLEDADKACELGLRTAEEFGLPYEAGLIQAIIQQTGLDIADVDNNPERLKALGVVSIPKTFSPTSSTGLTTGAGE